MTAALADPSFDEALRFFTAQTGLAFPGQRRRDFEAGARRAMDRHGLRDQDDLRESLQRDRRVLDGLVADLSVHESYFFREPAQFDALRELVLPRLRCERDPRATLNVWSAGCARGEEPYSLAILLEQQGLLDRSRILATDISRPALAEAGKARYSGWSFRGTQAALDRRYFDQRGAAFHLQARLRDRVTFEVLNLMSGPFAPPAGSAGFDLILCRNVLIYFEAPTVAKLAGWLHETLGEGGWLLTAPADPPLWDYAPFETQATPGGILYRKGAGGRAGVVARTARTSTAAASAPARAPARKALPKLDRPRKAAAATRPVADLADGLAEIRAVANSAGSADAERLATAATARHPMAPEAHYLRAVLLLDLSRWDEALTAVQQVLYLDRTLIAAHLLVGSILRRRGDLRGATRAYRHALRACAARRPDDLVELADGERVEQLAAFAAAQLGALDREGRSP